MVFANVHEKKLSPTAVTSKFSVPAALLRELVPVPGPWHEEEIRANDELGNVYTFQLRVRVTITPGGSRSLKPEFQQQGWLAFVNEKQLKAGESVYFWF